MHKHPTVAQAVKRYDCKMIPFCFKLKAFKMLANLQHSRLIEPSAN